MLKILLLALTAFANTDGLTDIDVKSLTDAVAPELAKCPEAAYHFDVQNKTTEYIDKTKIVEQLKTASGKVDKIGASDLKVELSATYSETDKMRRGKYTLQLTGKSCNAEARMNKVTRK